MNATQLCVFRLGPARFIDFTMREFLRQGWRAHLIKLNKTVTQWKTTKHLNALSKLHMGKGKIELNVLEVSTSKNIPQLNESESVKAYKMSINEKAETYHVSVECVFDSEQYNEWMNEEDYELDDNGRRKFGDMDMTYDELEASGEPRTEKKGKAKLGSKRKRSPSPTPKKKKGGSKSKKSKNNDDDEDNQTADVASKAEKYGRAEDKGRVSGLPCRPHQGANGLLPEGAPCLSSLPPEDGGKHTDQLPHLQRAHGRHLEPAGQDGD